MRKTAPLVLGLLAAATLARLATLTAPLDRDTGVYLYIGDRILHGGAPYVDAADNKGPVTFLLFAVIRLVAGHSATEVRLVLLIAMTLSALATAGWVARRGSRGLAVAAGSALALLGSSRIFEGDDPNTEQLGLLPMTLAWYAATRGEPWAAALAGSAAAMAGLMNLGFLAIVPVVLFEMVRTTSAVSRRRRIAVALGAGALVGLAVGAWLDAHGALPGFWEQVYGQARSVTAHVSLLDRLSFTHPPIWQLPGAALFGLALAGALLALRDPPLRPVALGALVFGGVMLARVELSGYYQDEQQLYYPCLPALAVGVVVGVAALVRRVPSPRVRLAAVIAAAMAAVAHYVVAPQLAVGRDVWPSDPDNNLAYPAARFLDAHTSPAAPVFFTGSIAQVYWLADRRAPTRFFHVFPIRWHRGYPAERRRELFADPPVALGELPGGRQREGRGDPLGALLRRFPYRLAWRDRGGRIWLLRGDPRARAPAA